jgi:ribosomal protein L29
METYLKQSEAELEKLLTEKQKALRDVRFGAAGGKSANVKESREMRKEIARIMTALNTK